MRYPSSVVTLLATVLMSALALPNYAAGQSVVQRIKDHATAKAKERKAKTDSTIVKAAGKAVDSTLEKTGRTVDTAVSVVGGVVDTVLNASERGVTSVLQRKGAGADPLIAQLANGRAVLPEIQFVASTDQLMPSAAEPIKLLGDALRTVAGVFLVEGHTDDSGDAGVNQALSEKRAEAVKARLIADGIAAERLFAIGYGATRPPEGKVADAASAQSKARIEVAKMK